MVDYSKCCFHISNLKKACLCLTEKCNFNCNYCFSKINKEQYIDMSKLNNIIDSLKKQNINYIIISGGEPLLYDQIIDVIELLKNSDFEISMCTNAFFATDDICKKMYNKGLKKVTIDFDNINKFEFEKIKGVSGGYEKVISGIKSFVYNNFEVTINVVIRNTDFNYFKSLVDLCENLNIKKICFTTPVCKNIESNKFSDKECDNIYQILSLLDNRTDLEIGFSNPQCTGKECPSGKLIFGVDSFGTLKPCLVKDYLKKE